MLQRKRFRISILDLFVLAALLLLAGYIAHRLGSSFNYRWNWSVIGNYLLFFDDDAGNWKFGILLQGLFITIKLSVWGLVLAAAIGLVVGILSITRRLFFRLSARTYVELIRNIPALVLVFIFYFFVSDQVIPLLHIDSLGSTLSPSANRVFTLLFSEPEIFNQFLSGVITLGLFQGAYIAEIVRAGIQSIDKGQWEASAALGLPWMQQMRHVILPQAVRNVLLPLANEFINTIKYSAIVSVISIQELTFQGMQVMASTQVTIEVWLTITAMYFVLCFALSSALGGLERKMARSVA
jgi:polar amino acid transport system permease protein